MAIEPKDIVGLLKKRPLAIACGVLSVALIAGIYFRSGRAGELAGELQQKEREGQRILDDIRNGANLPEQYQTLTAATKDLEARLVYSSERARNQQYFYRIESDTGVTEVNLQPSAAPTSNKRKSKSIYAPVSFDVTVRGDFSQILKFLQRLETGQHFYRLITAAVTRDASSTGALTLTLKLEFLGASS